jgi:hypothetical protein
MNTGGRQVRAAPSAEIPAINTDVIVLPQYPANQHEWDLMSARQPAEPPRPIAVVAGFVGIFRSAVAGRSMITKDSHRI